MPSNALFTGYGTRENRVTASMLAVFERLGPELTAKLLASAAGEEPMTLVEFVNQVRAKDASSIPDAVIRGSFQLLFEVKVVREDARLRSQVQEHLKLLDPGPRESRRLWVVTPDATAPEGIAGLASPLVTWISFRQFAESVSVLLREDEDPVPERLGDLLRELRRLLRDEGLVDQANTLVVAGGETAYAAFRESGGIGYVCQAERKFRDIEDVPYLAFYADQEIKPEISRIVARRSAVPFTRAEVDRLMESAEAVDQRFGETVECYMELEPRRRDSAWTVFLLDPAVRLGAGVPNTTESRSGRKIAWTQGLRYTQLSRLREATTTADLDSGTPSSN